MNNKPVWKARIPYIKKMMVTQGMKAIAEHYNTTLGALTDAMARHGVSITRVRAEAANALIPNNQE